VTSTLARRHCFHLLPSIKLVMDIVSGVEYLHSKGIVHRVSVLFSGAHKKIFAGFKSRCTIPFEWRYSTPETMAPKYDECTLARRHCFHLLPSIKLVMDIVSGVEYPMAPSECTFIILRSGLRVQVRAERNRMK
jgi:hypothetical protein